MKLPESLLIFLDICVSFGSTSQISHRTVGRTPCTGDQLIARPLPMHKHRETHTKQTPYFQALVEIRTHGPSVRASEGSSRLRSFGYLDQQLP
jgi:hypothetical protein